MAHEPQTPPKPAENEVPNAPKPGENVDRDGREQQPDAHAEQTKA